MADPTEPPDAGRPRRGTGAGPKVELAGHDEAQSTPHDPGRCATCCGFEPWTDDRRAEAEQYAAQRRSVAC